MPLPRNLRAKNQSAKEDANRLIEKNTKALESICDKHHVRKLSFNNCKLITLDGKQIFIEYDFIKGSLRSGVLLIKANSTSNSTSTYDLVELENNKKSKEINKENRDYTDENNNKENEIKEEKEEKEDKEDKNKKTDGQLDKTTEINKMKSKLDKRRSKILEKRKNAVERMNEDLKKKSDSTKHNKYYRHFMRNLRERFTLIEDNSFRYFEVNINTTDMVIDKVKVYHIKMPVEVKEKYLLIVGDLQLKSGLLKTIDPNHKSEKMYQEQTEFMERIRAKEGTLVKEAVEDCLDREVVTEHQISSSE